MHKSPIDLKTASDDALASYATLSAALEEMKKGFAAGDEYTGKETRLLTTKPGPDTDRRSQKTVRKKTGTNKSQQRNLTITCSRSSAMFSVVLVLQVA